MIELTGEAANYVEFRKKELSERLERRGRSKEQPAPKPVKKGVAVSMAYRARNRQSKGVMGDALRTALFEKTGIR